ncbi:hypothetical protein [Quisquiliibacterium transsilvanicum]|uniref:HipA N-terminal subdomain 1 domain-containing protein n=1 Tax=Quisquiliibacterium transsilvanicum TaxID=1549638 RepID=A0A7W8MAV7_9BURK|nr:hypothetical protein [Quisquiliibacterium transsilvanicum]MBB5273509.1 hypothetical protein [Quisquiliibacterium transsilvanicum]
MVLAAPVRQKVQVCIGKAGLAVGSLVYVRQGRRENSAFAYDEGWLADPERFNVSADRESKTWLSEQDGPITDVKMLLGRASYFALDGLQALAVLAEVHSAVSNWRRLAVGPEVGLRPAELDDFAPAFEHAQMDAVAALLRGA